MYRPLFPVEKWQQVASALEGLLFHRATRQLLTNSQFSSSAQWNFSGDELELLTLYLSQGVVGDFRDYCLVEHENGYLSKGSHYFKQYGRRYTAKHYTAFAAYLCRLIPHVESTAFDEEDQGLQVKMLLVTAEELLNHMAWGVYLAYQAAGVRSSFSESITPGEMQTATRSLLRAAVVYLGILTHSSADTKKYLEAIAADLAATNLKFISHMAKKAPRDSEGSFYRERLGSNEVANALHALRLRSEMEAVDTIVAPYYDSVSAAAFGYAALREKNDELDFAVHCCNDIDDHVRCGEWRGKERRGILERIAKIPPLARPEQNVVGKNVVVVVHSLRDVEVAGDLCHFYRKLGAEVQLTAVAADSPKRTFRDSPLSHKDLEFHCSPWFVDLTISDLRHSRKHAERFSPRHPK